MAMVWSLAPAASHAAAEPTGAEVYEHCNVKYPGEDQRSRLSIILRDKDNNEKKNVYRRFWKGYKGKDGVFDKMVLFTEFPPDARGAAFMRWAYTDQTDKNADQWIYLPVLKKIRRVSVRDPGDSFLGSDLTYADISDNPINPGRHKLLRRMEKGDMEVFGVETVPTNPDKALYSRVITWFTRNGASWDSCHKRQVDYYDKRGEPLKQQFIKWQRVGKAWVWDEVLVRNVQTGHSSVFQVSDVEINVDLDEEVFTERALRLGARRAESR